MGKRVEWDYKWMQNIKRLVSVNVRTGSEHTVEYVDKEGNACIVRIPAVLVGFLADVNTLQNRKRLPAAMRSKAA